MDQQFTKDVDLKELFSETSQTLLAEKKQAAQGFIKDLIKRYEYLVIDVDQKRKQLVQAEDSMQRTKEKIEKIKTGDWSVLESLIKNPQQLVKPQKEKETLVNPE